uniref:Auxin efflux carrier component n=1 Tax=Tetradesmus obliquus TaxID=3088 RepID=A0A383WG39_TETOB|eukprot:jgi/Sobl393_1/6577/SZX76014.1
MIEYSSIFQTGIQSLLAVACGWGCGRWGVLQPDPTVVNVNTLVLKFCIPCLQVHLLAIKTDMRQPGSWSALLAFLAWSMGLQALLALLQLLRQGRLQYAQLGVDSLLLTTNNTGILGPVVLLAALGPEYAPLGMLATVALYFQQLPSAQLLFHLHQEQAAAAAGTATTAAVTAADSMLASDGHGWQEQQPLLAAGQAGNDGSNSISATRNSNSSAAQGSRASSMLADGQAGAQHGNGSGFAFVQPGAAVTPEASSARITAAEAAAGSRRSPLHAPQQLLRHCGSADSLPRLHHRHAQQEYVLHVGKCTSQQQQQQGSSCGAGQDRHSSASLVLSLLLKNPLVWSTGLSLLLSCLGSSVLLDPRSPVALQQLSFVDGLLGWFAATTAPLTLFTTGLWMYSNSLQQQQRQAQKKGQPSLMQQQHQVAGPVGANQEEQEQLTMRQLWMYLLARATVAPGFMVLVCRVMGFKGDLGRALVILALLPVAQTAFVVCKQAETGTHAISVLMVASLLVMLPQLMVLLALLEWFGVF